MAWFAFDIDAYDADTMHLSAAEDGIYMRLLRFYYKTRVPLPDDDRALANIARIPFAEWETVKATIRAFFRARRGKLHHTRCDAELDKEDKLSLVRSERSARAAEKRWGKTRTKGMPVASVEHAAGMPALPPSSDVVMLGDATRPDHIYNPPTPRRRGDDDSPEFKQFWEAYPNKTAKPAARRAFPKAIRKAPLETILSGLRRYIAGKPPDREWMHPATFLNGERWNDQPALAVVPPAQPPPRERAPKQFPVNSPEWLDEQRKLGLA